MHQASAINTETLLKLREAVVRRSANFDRLTSFGRAWIRLPLSGELGGYAIFHAHAKDTRLDKYNKERRA